MNPVEVFSPAKINLFLAVTGRRADGFHDLLSVAAPLAWGDTLRARVRAEGGDFSLACDDPAVPAGPDNLVLRAAARFRELSGWPAAVAFTLEKRIPMGAGLGGGSSNAAAALRAMNELAGGPLTPAALAAAAAEIGSDCALFLPGAPVVMRGRGERIALLEASAAARIRGRRVVVFKPAFPVPTPWAYGRLAERRAYASAAEAEETLARWVSGSERAEALLANGFESVVFEKFPALPALLGRLRRDFGLEPRMSGSGSACFALLPEEFVLREAEEAIRAAWGPSTFILETMMA